MNLVEEMQKGLMPKATARVKESNQFGHDKRAKYEHRTLTNCGTD